MGFFVVYIQEAHPVDLWQVSSNVEDGVLFASPQTAGERADPAGICVVKLAIKMPAVVDGIDNRVERNYTGWPDRLYVVGTDGRVRYKSAPRTAPAMEGAVADATSPGIRASSW